MPHLWDQNRLQSNQVLIPKDGCPFPLYVWCARMRPGLLEKLDLCSAIAAELDTLQFSGRVMNILIPSDIIVRPQAQGCRVVLTALENRMGRHDDPMLMDAHAVRDVLPYLAPEQCGRMFCDGDTRSLFYSLGAIFYEIISGRPPFDSDDPLELIHGHMARQPVCLTLTARNTPYMVSRLVFKLMAKNPEDRYQGMKSMMRDLNRCIGDYEKHGDVESFALGADDVPDKLRFPSKLYGRDKERETLRMVYDRLLKGGPGCLMVSGEPGTGKTSLVHEFGLRVRERGGYFAYGKYDPIGKRIPYSGLKACLRDMVRQILTEKPHRLAIWRQKLVRALTPSGKILTDDIPDLEHVTGQWKDVPPLPPVEARNRFRDVYSNFIRSLPDDDHPVVLFLDDLQWADSASLDFIQWFLSEDIHGKILFIGSFRLGDNTRNNREDLNAESIRFQGRRVVSMILSSIDQTAVDELIGDTFKNTKNSREELSSLIYWKTQGNPFLVKRLIQNLYDGKRLNFDIDAGKWIWNLEAQPPAGPVDDRGQFLQDSMDKLPEKTLDLLFTASCLGNRFNLDSLSSLCGEDRDSALLSLRPALDRLFIRHAMAWDFEFTHDRIRLAVYGMIPDRLKKKLHLSIGRESMKDTGSVKNDESFFYTVNQMNLGSDLLVCPCEKLELAKLNLSAAVRARKSTALDAVCRYSRAALGLLPADRWESTYPTVFQLFMVLAECEYLTGHIAEAERIFDDELSKAKWRLDKARVINLRIVLYTAGGRIGDAVQYGIIGLRLFGETMPQHPGKARVAMEYARTWIALRMRSMNSLSLLPELTDLEKKETMNLFINMGTPAYYLGPEYFVTVVVRAVRFCLKHGMSPAFPMGLISFGLVTCFGFGLYRSGFMFAETGLKLLESMDDTTFKARAYFVFGFFIVGWREHAAKSVQAMRLARHYGMETGALIYSGHSINAVFMTRLIAGEKLDDITPEFKDSYGLMKRLNDPFITGNYLDNLRMIRILKDGVENISRKDEERRENEIRQLKNPLALFMFLNIRLRCDYYFGNFRRCMEISEKIKAIGHIPVGTLYLVEYCFYDSLTLAACATTGEKSLKRKNVRSLKRNAARLKKWANLCPGNFEHKFLLVSAEIRRLGGQAEQAMNLYGRAADAAEKNGYIQNVGLAHKLAADCLLERDRTVYARPHLEEAVAKWSYWGADAVVKHLQAIYADLLARDGSHSTFSLIRLVDQRSVEQALRALATEINLKTLLRKILQITMENAGATRGMYLSVLPEGLFIEAESRAGSPEFILSEAPIPVDRREDLLSEAIYYTLRTGRPVILKDAAEDGDYAASAYVSSTRLKSVLVLPVFRQADMTAVLYLENRMTSGVFTEQRLRTLRLIAAQSAISVENARLYAEVIGKEERLRALSAELMFAEEQTRRKIAVELHDGIGHALTTMRMTLSMAQESGNPEEIQKDFRDVFEILDRCAQDIQSLTFDLSPPVLYDFGLMAALEWLSNKTRVKHGLTVEIRGCPHIVVAESMRVTVFQIVRELVFNCVKHAQASKVLVDVVHSEKKLTVTVVDDGRGFRTPLKEEPGKNRAFGLFSSRERVRYMAGEFQIESEPGKGTKIVFSLPEDTGQQPINGVSF